MSEAAERKQALPPSLQFANAHIPSFGEGGGEVVRVIINAQGGSVQVRVLGSILLVLHAVAYPRSRTAARTRSLAPFFQSGSAILVDNLGDFGQELVGEGGLVLGRGLSLALEEALDVGVIGPTSPCPPWGVNLGARVFVVAAAGMMPDPPGQVNVVIWSTGFVKSLLQSGALVIILPSRRRRVVAGAFDPPDKVVRGRLRVQRDQDKTVRGTPPLAMP